LDGPHQTIEAAKDAFQLTYKEKFDVEWTERETAVSDRWTYEVKTYETFEETESVEEVVDETEVATIITKEEQAVVDDVQVDTQIVTTTTTTQEEVVLEHVTKTVVNDDIETEGVKEITITETGKVSEPAVPKGSSWFRKVISTTEAAARGAADAVGDAAGAVGSAASGAAGAVVHGAESAARGVGHVAGAVVIGTGVVAVGAGLAAAGALHKVDGIWKRTVQVLTTRKAHVDKVCPIAKTAYVYYDEDVYDAVLTEKNTGVTYVTQLIYDTETKVYY
ncbi:hypothetical protein BGX26_008341, partial [Mortierella sp. AD094]